MTHAFFKALLFLGAGSVIIGMHHDQDMPQHGRPAQVHADHLDHVADRLAGADRHAVLLGLLFEGRDHRGGHASRYRRVAGFAYFAVLAGVFVTAFYSFRMYFLVFHGEERFGRPRRIDSPTTMPKRTHGTVTTITMAWPSGRQAARVAMGGDAAAGAAGDSVGHHRRHHDRARCCSASSSSTASRSRT